MPGPNRVQVDAAKRWEAAMKEPTLDRAIARYGVTAECSFWSMAARRGEAKAVRAKYADDLKVRRAKAHKASQEQRNASRAIYHERQQAAFVEDAEFLAHHGEVPDRAAKRLGMASWASTYTRLHRYNRLDIADRLLANADPDNATGKVPQGIVHDPNRAWRP